MIILPDTPPVPKLLKSSISSQLISSRAALTNLPAENYNDLTRYVVNGEHYIEDLFEHIESAIDNNNNNNDDISQYVEYAGNQGISKCSPSPWSNIKFKDGQLKFNFEKVLNSKKAVPDWTLYNEIELAIIAVSTIYTRMGSELTNELIDLPPSDEVTEKWKQVVNLYKKSISYVQFGIQISNFYESSNHINGGLFIFLERLNYICIQMTMLSKSSWINRHSYNGNETFTTTNNGTLCRVAIYVLDELKSCQRLLSDLTNNSSYLISYDCSQWIEYLSVIEKYATAYAGLFFSIETYQHHKLGQSIGLINFSLLNLQSKKINEISPKSSKLTLNLKSKLSSRKNDIYIKNLQSITGLNLKSSIFNEKSGIVLKDITFLFDQLVHLHLKFTKENENLKFDTITNYQDIHNDSKWPLGSKIPVSQIPSYIPKVLEPSISDSGNEGKRPYY